MQYINLNIYGMAQVGLPSQSTDDLIYKDELVVDYVQELIFMQ